MADTPKLTTEPVEPMSSTPPSPAPAPSPMDAPQEPATSQQSSEGPNGPFPAELAKFSWGALVFGWLWAFFHGLGIEGVVLIILNFIFAPAAIAGNIYLGINGNKLAWAKRRFESVEQFNAVQKAWNVWAIVFLIPIVAVLFFSLSFLMSNLT